MNERLIPYLRCKKHSNAVFAACDDKYAFCLYVSLSSFIENSPALACNCDILVAGYHLSSASKKALSSLPAVTVVDYEYPGKLPNTPAIRSFTAASFARYDCFALLEHYEKILYLDSDVLVRQELCGVFDLLPGGAGLTRDPLFSTVRGQFFVPVSGFDMGRIGFNSGFIALNRSCFPVNRPSQIMQWCYQMTQQEAEKLFLPDQGIINLALEYFQINASVLPDNYNCPASAPKRFLDRAFIIHSTGPRKFWCYYYFESFYRHYKTWISLGGAPVSVRHGDSRLYLWVLKKTGLEGNVFFQLCPDFFTKPLKALRFAVKRGLHLPY